MLKNKGYWLKQDFRDSSSEPSPARMNAEIIHYNAKYELGKNKITLYIHHTHGLISYKVKYELIKLE